MARKRLIMYLIVITMLVTFVGCVGGQKGPVKYEGPFAEENGTCRRGFLRKSAA